MYNINEGVLHKDKEGMNILHTVIKRKAKWMNLTFIGPCIANIFAEYNQQVATFRNLFISVRRSTCFRRVFRPSSGAQMLQPAASPAGLAAGCSISLRNS